MNSFLVEWNQGDVWFNSEIKAVWEDEAEAKARYQHDIPADVEVNVIDSYRPGDPDVRIVG